MAFEFNFFEGADSDTRDKVGVGAGHHLKGGCGAVSRSVGLRRYERGSRARNLAFFAQWKPPEGW